MKKSDEALLELARSRLSEAIDADEDNRDRAKDDLDKLVGNQWPEEIRAQREADSKPVITINRMPQFVRQVTGDIRRLNPAINVSPADNEATKETAEVLEGLIRHIEYRSDASSVYEQTAESAAGCSIGWFRIVNEWEDEDSFDQEILIKRIRNPFSVYIDPNAEMPTREDAEWGFITERMTRREFEKKFPGKSAVDVEHDDITDGLENWHTGDAVIIAEYYWKEYRERTLLLLVDGSTIFKDEVDKERFPDGIPDEAIARERKVQSCTVKWAKISGKDVLEGPKDIPCKYIPLIAVTGEEWHTGDEVYRSGVIRFAKDAQQMYNYFRSSSAEMVTLQPKAPYIGTLKQFTGLETYWQNANSSNYSFLPYNPDEKAPGPPQRQSPPIASQGLTQEAFAAAEDMKATTGIYDAGLGNQSNEKSGVAIRQRQMESDVSTSIYTDNMAKAIAHCGRILLSMIPKVYDTARVLRIIGKDGTEKMVDVNRQVVAGGIPQKINDLQVGKYDIRVSVGPNYSTRRQETAEGMLEFIRVVPGAAQMVGDLVAKAMDWPDADVIADRLKKTLPPQLQDQEDMDPQQQQQMAMAMQQQQVQAQMAQQAQMTEMRKAQAEAVEAEADAQKSQYETAEAQLELALKSGALNAAIAQAVQEQVARVLLSGTPAPQGPF